MTRNLWGLSGLSVFSLGAPCRFVELGQRRQQGFEVPVVSLPFSRTVLDAHTRFLEDMQVRDQLAHVSRQPVGVFCDYRADFPGPAVRKQPF
jgi:hypothetical protein